MDNEIIKIGFPITLENEDGNIDDALLLRPDEIKALEYKLQELDKYKNIVDELERYIKDELILDFYNDDMPCELIVNKMLKQIKELKGE